MKLLTFILSLFIFSQCYAEPINTVGIPLPLNDVDSVSIYIDGYSYYLNEATRVSREVREYAVKITPVKYDVQAFIDVLNYTKNITPAQLDIIRYELAKYDVTKFTDIGQWIKYIETYQAVKDYGTDLKNAVSSVRVSHYIQAKDYVKLRAELAGVIPSNSIEALIGTIQNPVFPVLATPPFFTAIGEVKYDTDLSKFPDYVKLVVPVYIKDIKNFKTFVDKVKKTNLQIIPAFDFNFDVVFLSDILVYKSTKNTKGEPIFHSAISLWGVTNIIDMNDYIKASQMAFELWVVLKYDWPDLWVWRTMCLFPEFETIGERKDAKWGDSVKFGDGDWWWNIHSYPAFEIEGNAVRRVREISGARPVVLGGFFGSYPVFNVTYAIEHFPKLEEQWQREGWNGGCLINIDNWLKVLK